MESAPSPQSESIRPISKNKPATVCNPPPRPPRRSSKCTSGRSGRVCAIHLLAQTRKVSNQSRIKQSSHVVQSTLWPSGESIKFTSRRSGLVCAINTLAQTRKYQLISTKTTRPRCAIHPDPPRGPRVEESNSLQGEVMVPVQSTSLAPTRKYQTNLKKQSGHVVQSTPLALK